MTKQKNGSFWFCTSHMFANIMPTDNTGAQCYCMCTVCIVHSYASVVSSCACQHVKVTLCRTNRKTKKREINDMKNRKFTAFDSGKMNQTVQHQNISHPMTSKWRSTLIIIIIIFIVIWLQFEIHSYNNSINVPGENAYTLNDSTTVNFCARRLFLFQVFMQNKTIINETNMK